LNSRLKRFLPDLNIRAVTSGREAKFQEWELKAKQRRFSF